MVAASPLAMQSVLPPLSNRVQVQNQPPQTRTKTTSSSTESMRLELNQIPGTDNWQVKYSNTSQVDNQPPQTRRFQNIVPRSVIAPQLESMSSINQQLETPKQAPSASVGSVSSFFDEALNEMMAPLQTPALAENPFDVDLNGLVSEWLGDLNSFGDELGAEFKPQKIQITIELDPDA